MIERVTWRLIVDGGRPGSANMAIDAALLEMARSAPPGGHDHTLRLYWFEPAALSIGSFQPLAEVDLAACTDAGIDVVRRPSGGRAVLHDADLTYAICGPAEGPVFGGGIHPSYKRVAAALVEALRRLGLDDAAAAPADARPDGSSPWCFASTAPYEALAAGTKLIGSAQARRGTAALQHGSLRLNRPRFSICTLIRPRAGRPPARMLPELPVLSDLLGRSVGRDEAIACLLTAFADSFGVELVPGLLTQPERDCAERLIKERFACLDARDQRSSTFTTPRREA